jgi:hypothetical protein
MRPPQRYIPSSCPAIAVALCLCMVATVRTACGQEDIFDQVDNQLSYSNHGDTVRARVSGTLDLEGYSLSQPDSELLYPEGREFFAPRLSLFLDAQIGSKIYVFVQSRADTGFDPGDGGQELRLDEYVVRYTPWENGALNIQVGKFATMVGNWTPRHGSWDNPFVTAPLPYDYLTGVWDAVAVRSTQQLQLWGGVHPAPVAGGAYLDISHDIPIIWGPSYGSGAAAFGAIGKVDYALEVKNTSLSGRPDTWSPTETQWQQPTVSGRLGYRPDEMWSIGFSASDGTYLASDAEATLPPGRSLSQYTELVFGQDIGFAWHHLQMWAEAYEAQFRIPGVGNADTQAYYIEAKYKFTPQLFGAIRWNQQLFSTLPTTTGQAAEWDRNVWRVDIGPCYRFTPHTQLKLQYSVEYQQADLRNWGDLLAVQFTTRF